VDGLEGGGAGRRADGALGRRRERRRRPRPRGRRLLGGHLSLRREALQVRHESQPQRVLHVHALDAHHVARHLGGALPEAQTVVVHRQAVCFVRVIATY